MQFKIKRGEVLSLDFTRKDAAGAAVDITNDTITASVQLRDFTAALTVTKTNAVAGEFTISATAAQTQLWPVATLDADTKYDGGGGNIKRSETFRIKVDKEITP